MNVRATDCKQNKKKTNFKHQIEHTERQHAYTELNENAILIT